VLLERALLATFVMHGLAMLSMATLLLPGMPGGGIALDADRIQYLAQHPWLWRLGWLPWQLTAASDLLLALALVRTRWIPRLASVLSALVTVAAVVPDQLGQACWITTGLTLARGPAPAYLAYEARIFAWTAAWGATLYTIGALGWTWCFAAGRAWTRTLGVLSAVLWPLFLAVSLAPLVGADARLVAAGNALGFVLLMLWLALVTEQVMRRARPVEPSGRWAPWRHPRLRPLDWIANSRWLRAWGQLAPMVALRSDIEDVLYVSYVVPADRLAALVPAGLELQRLGPGGAHALFTFLSYRHGHFGPRLLGPLRRLLPSPVQSNWRIHVREPRTGAVGVYFVSTAISATAYALGARLLAEGMPMHVPLHAEISARAGAFHLRLDPGAGSAPDAEAILTPTEAPTDGPWRVCFATWRDFLAYAVPQDRAFTTDPALGRVIRLEIDLGIPLGACQPLAGEVRSRAARVIAGDAEAFSFRVPRVAFLFRGEEAGPASVGARREGSGG
jgi:hypothetical protein